MNAQPPALLGLAASLRWRAARDPHKPALTDDAPLDGRGQPCDAPATWSYAELQQRVERMADALAAGGVTRGDRVGYLGLNDPLFLVAMYATVRLGGIFVPLNFRLTGHEHAFIVEDAGIHTLLVDEPYLDRIEGVRDTLRCGRLVRLRAGAGQRLHWEVLRDEATTRHVDEAPTAPDDVALILYTSGTTGRPKGAMLTHENLWANGLNSMLAIGTRTDDVTLNFAPLFHVGGLCSVSLPTLLAGGHLVLQRSFDAEAVMRAIREHRITVSFAVPSMLLMISQHPRFAEADLSSLRVWTVGGAPMPPALLRLYGERGIPVHQGYGMTETTSTVTFLNPIRAQDKRGSCGTRAPLNEVRIVGFDGVPVTRPNTRGELRVRGANVMRGYWNRPDATHAAFDADGWLRTGDVAYADEEGFLTLCDRIKDMLISGGENVYPAEVEGVLHEHPAIAEVAVIGAPDEKWGERVVAVVSLKPGETLTLESLQAFAELRLARYKLPRELRLVAALPRNPTGKILKAQLRATDC
jgi:fatty-acyl-CoA synthase